MRTRISLVLVAAQLLVGCLSVSAGFNPVRGPLSQRTPVPAYIGSMTGVVLSGTITVTLDGGEKCTGPWKQVSKTDPAENVPPPPDVASQWDAVFGSGYYLAHVLGNGLYMRGIVTGNQGTVLTVEVSNESNRRGETRGIALDNKGNLFKVTVYN